MPEAGHESVEEDRRGSVSEGLFRADLRRRPARELPTPSHLFAIRVRTADKTNGQHHGRESTKSRSPRPRCAKMRTTRHQQFKKEIALSTDRKAGPPDCFLHLAAQQRQNICGRRLFHQSAVAERSAELVTDFAFTTDESSQGALSV